jgi:hypothetical protein
MKYMNLKWSCVLIFLLVSKISVCQNAFKTGYIVTVHNETINGFVDVNSLEKNPGRVEFKSAPTSVPIRYNPLEIKFVSVSGRSFIGSVFVIKHEADETTGLRPEPEMDTLFLELLATGNLKLYSLKANGSEPRFFVQRKESGLDELINVHAKEQPGIPGVKLRKYQTLLSMLMADVADTKPLIRDLEFDKKALSLLITYYNDRAKLSFQDKGKRIYSFTLLAEASFMRSDFSSSASSFLGDDETLVLTDENPAWFSPMIGIGMQMGRYGSKNRISFYQEVSLVRVQFEYGFKGIVRPEYYNRFYFNYDEYLVQYKCMPRYNFTLAGGRMKPYAEAGITVSVPVIKNNEAYEEKYFYAQTTRSELQTRNGGISLTAGAGINYRRFSAGFDYGTGWYKSISMKVGVKL